MTFRYINRVGKTYYLRKGKTKTGKPRYFFTSQEDGKGEVVARTPEGYEIYEHPENAQVFLRKKRPRLITDEEEQFVKKYLDKLKSSRRYLIDCKDEHIIIYESNIDTENIKGIFSGFLSNIPARSGINADEAMTAIANVADSHYTAVLRFHLHDRERRTFTAERFCFRGAIDDWIYLDGPDDFRTIVIKNSAILGKDEFFDSTYL